MEFRDRDMLDALGKKALEEWRLTNLIRVYEASVGKVGWVGVEPIYIEIMARLGISGTMPNAGDLR
jgi:hypothetical protein